MNSNRRVLLFVIYSTVLYLLFSIGAFMGKLSWTPFRRVNLVADIVSEKKESKPIPATDTAINTVKPVVVEQIPLEDFSLYNTARRITDFKTDSTRPSLTQFSKKLYELKKTGKGKIRIAYFGDSMIEGDLLTQTLRKLLQQEFGGNGVGFVPITSQVSKFRETVIANYPDGWEEENFKEGKNRKLYLSGHVFHTPNAWVQMMDRTITQDSVAVEKSLLCGFLSGGTNVGVNKTSLRIQPDQPVNRIVLNKDISKSIGVSVANDLLPVYGISFESESGVFVDNFSFRGITGIEFARIDSTFLSSIASANPYDLVVFQYGVNLLFRPNDRDFNWYAELILPIVRRISHCFTGSDFVLVSTADRAFRYAGEYKSAIGIDSLVKIQASVAYATGNCFYNQFATMGGTNSIVDWAKQKPALARQDYVHPNNKGAEVLANYFYEAILADYQKYARSQNN